MTERTRDGLLDELVRMTNARDLLANTADRLIEERDAARRALKGAVAAERERIVKALREQAACYPEGSRYEHVGRGYLGAAEFIEALDRAQAVGP